MDLDDIHIKLKCLIHYTLKSAIIEIKELNLNKNNKDLNV